MPLFGLQRRRNGDSPVNGVAAAPKRAPPTPRPRSSVPPMEERAHPLPRPELVFHCQLAHGSPTGIITGFSNVKELYERIAECYDMSSSEILFCTLNTHKVDMDHLLGAQIGLDDFIFVHRKGQAKEIEIEKTEEALGLTITDNGAGCAFIKRIQEGSVADQIGYVKVGDQVERIDGTSLVDCRHYQVAKMLKDIPVGTTFLLRVVEPMSTGFANIGPRSGPKTGKATGYGSGKATLRLRANGPARIEQAPTNVVQSGVNKINSLLEGFLGINDTELAGQIWELSSGQANTVEFAAALDCSDLEAFGFTEDFVIELWGAITDIRAGRLDK
ncbi:PDZ domain-containing protein GIPC3-like [Pollicipes pollicipes]|uniref:PDZ domain-containing protein GIPC3-like n=1 Tax=Pollicipes pollicipes TaxID=41117 RepID=UPI00188573AE|nr:PDZ domain-containing protein GIPC3-like [Pollicipes pollicipes]